MGTKQRILEASLKQFNEYGERNVTTNHIANHLGISPGNLYYHFKNKQEIIYNLFVSYEERLLSCLSLPDNRDISINDKVVYLREVFEGIWDYRFLHRDMEHLLSCSDTLRERYQKFFRICLQRIILIFSELDRVGIIKASKLEIQQLALNTWIVVTSWFSFLRGHVVTTVTENISKDMLQRGIYQVFSLERPYLSEEYKGVVASFQEQFSTDDSWLMGSTPTDADS